MQLKAEHLHIGNLFYWEHSKNGYETIRLSLLDLKSISEKNDGYQHYYPIEIENDILLKIGFKKIESNKYGCKNYYVLGDYDLFQKDKDWFFVIANYMDVPPEVKINYIHEIQNILIAFKKSDLLTP